MVNLLRRTHRTTSLVVGSLTALALLWGATGSPATASADRSSPGPVVLTGDLPAAGAAVSVEVQPTGKVLARMPLGVEVPSRMLSPKAVSVEGSRYVVRLDPSTLSSRFLDDQGVATFHIRATDAAGRMWASTASSRAVSVDGGPGWTDPLASSGLVRVPVHAGTHVPPLAQVSGRDGAGSAFRATDTVSTASATCPYHVILQRGRAMATSGTSYPVGGDKAHMVISHTQGAYYGTTDSVHEYHPYKAGLGWAGGSWGFSWVWDNVAKSYRIEVAYALHRWGRRDTHYNCILEYSWQPTVETGGVSSHRKIPRPSWGNCVQTDPGSWTRNLPGRHPYDYSIGVSASGFVGVNLPIRRQYSGYQKIVYHLQNYRRMCGNNGYPAVAGKQMERYR